MFVLFFENTKEKVEFYSYLKKYTSFQPRTANRGFSLHPTASRRLPLLQFSLFVFPKEHGVPRLLFLVYKLGTPLLGVQTGNLKKEL